MDADIGGQVTLLAEGDVSSLTSCRTTDSTGGRPGTPYNSLLVLVLHRTSEGWMASFTLEGFFPSSWTLLLPQIR